MAKPTYDSIVFLLVAGALVSTLSACGGGGAGTPGDNNDNGPESGTSGSGERLLTDVTGRGITLATLRNLHWLQPGPPVFVASGSTAPATGTVACEKGGTRRVNTTDPDGVFGNLGDVVSISFQQCVEETAVGEQTITGGLTVTYGAGGAELSADSLSVSGPSLSDTMEIRRLSVTAPADGDGVTLSFEADYPVFDISGVSVHSADPISGEDLNCPSSGALVLVASDNSQSLVTFSPGGNMLLTVDNKIKSTLACSEISDGGAGSTSSGNGDNGGDSGNSGGGGLIPPPVPEG